MDNKKWTMEKIKDEAAKIGINLEQDDAKELVDILDLMHTAYNIGYEKGKAAKV